MLPRSLNVFEGNSWHPQAGHVFVPQLTLGEKTCVTHWQMCHALEMNTNHADHAPESHDDVKKKVWSGTHTKVPSKFWEKQGHMLVSGLFCVSCIVLPLCFAIFCSDLVFCTPPATNFSANLCSWKSTSKFSPFQQCSTRASLILARRNMDQVIQCMEKLTLSPTPKVGQRSAYEFSAKECEIQKDCTKSKWGTLPAATPTPRVYDKLNLASSNKTIVNAVASTMCASSTNDITPHPTPPKPEKMHETLQPNINVPPKTTVLHMDVSLKQGHLNYSNLLSYCNSSFRTNNIGTTGFESETYLHIYILNLVQNRVKQSLLFMKAFTV